MTPSILSDIASGQITGTQEAGLWVLGITFLVFLVAWNVRSQRDASRGKR